MEKWFGVIYAKKTCNYPYNTAIPFSGIYTTEMNAYVVQNTCVRMFIAALLTIALDQMSVNIRMNIQVYSYKEHQREVKNIARNKNIGILQT